MKGRDRAFVAIIMALVLSAAYVTSISANSAAPPDLTILVRNPPDDLSLSLEFSDGGRVKAVELREGHKAWETYYRFFYYMYPQGAKDLHRATLAVQSDGENLSFDWPEGFSGAYNSYLTLDFRSGRLTAGPPWYRTPFLVTMRIGLTLLIEGMVFFLFGYRRRKSWIAFLAVNLVTQGWLNLEICGLGIDPYPLSWMIVLVFGEVLVLAAELIAFVGLVKEYGKARAALHAVAANAASLVLGGLLLMFLPI